MKKKLCLTLLLCLFHLGFSLHENHDTLKLPGFCWKNTYLDEPVGVPSKCINGRVKIGNQCFEDCPSGYTKYPQNNDICFQNCPKQKDWEIFWKQQYPNSFFAYCKLKDSGKRYNQLNPCQQQNGYGNCIKSGNYYFAGRPVNCQGFNPYYSSKFQCLPKHQSITFTMVCDTNLIYDNGLCYKPCKEGYYRYGKICWQKAGKAQCGLGFASTQQDCFNVKKDDIFNIGQKANQIISDRYAGKTIPYRSIRDFYFLYITLQQSDRVRELLIKYLSNQAIKDIIYYTKLRNQIDIYKEINKGTITVKDLLDAEAQIAYIISPTGPYNKFPTRYPKCKP